MSGIDCSFTNTFECDDCHVDEDDLSVKDSMSKELANFHLKDINSQNLANTCVKNFNSQNQCAGNDSQWQELRLKDFKSQ
eukprot:4393543-Karenia_brevis.AAC.1